MARRPGGESEPGRFRFRARTTIINNIPASRLHFTPLTMDNCVTIMFRVGRVWPRGTMAWWSHCPYRAAQPDKDATFVLKWARAREANRENGGETERTGESMRRDGERWKKGESGWHGPSTTAPQSSNEIWLEINHRGVRAHVAAGLGSGASIRSRVFVRRVPPPLDRGPSRDAHAHAVKQHRTAARSARTRYYESRGPSSGENNGQPFRDNDELALHLACVYVYHAATLLTPRPRPCRSLSPRPSHHTFSLSRSLRVTLLFRAHCVPAHPTSFISNVRHKWSPLRPYVYFLHSYGASRCSSINSRMFQLMRKGIWFLGNWKGINFDRWYTVEVLLG